MQNYYAHMLPAGVEQFWRSLDAPPPLAAVLKTHPIQFVAFYARNLPFLFYFMLAYVSGWNKIVALLYLLLTALDSYAGARIAAHPSSKPARSC